MRKVKKKSRSKGQSRSAVFLKVITFFFRFLIKPVPVIIIAVSGLCAWFYFSGFYGMTVDKINYAENTVYTKSGLILKDVYLEGHNHTSERDIVKAIDLKIGQPITNIDIWAIKERLEKLTWVKYAVVERQYPSSLTIRMVERQPVAIWQNKGEVSLIDADGKVIHENNLNQYKDMVILVGDDIPMQISVAMSIINANKLNKNISSLIRVGNRRWDIKLKNGVKIKLPEYDTVKWWNYVSAMNDEENILDSGISSIDLRVTGKMFIK